MKGKLNFCSSIKNVQGNEAAVFVKPARADEQDIVVTTALWRMCVHPDIHVWTMTLISMDGFQNLAQLFSLTLLHTIPTFNDPFENIVEKGENAGNQHFLLFPQCFLPFQIKFQFLIHI